MKILIKILLFLFLCGIAAKSWSDQKCREYGVALLMPQEYLQEAQRINNEIVAQIRKENLPNVFHITLFQGCFFRSDIDELYQKVKSWRLKAIKIALVKEIKGLEKKYINWPVYNNNALNDLHILMLNNFGPQHHGALARYIDSYRELNAKQRRQVDFYGVAGVLDEYAPHVTLFYFANKNSEIDDIIKNIAPPRFGDEVMAGTVAIGELGYNGNMEKVLYSVELE